MEARQAGPEAGARSRFVVQIDRLDCNHPAELVPIDVVDHALARSGPVGDLPRRIASLGLERDGRVPQLIGCDPIDAGLVAQAVERAPKVLGPDRRAGRRRQHEPSLLPKSPGRLDQLDLLRPPRLELRVNEAHDVASDRYAQRVERAFDHLRSPNEANASYADDGVTRQYFHSRDTIQNELGAAGIDVIDGPTEFYYPWEVTRSYNYGFYPGQKETWDWIVIGRKTAPPHPEQ